MKWKKIKEIEACPSCGSPLLVIHNDSNREAWAECEDCDTETPLSFVSEPDEQQEIESVVRTESTLQYILVDHGLPPEALKLIADEDRSQREFWGDQRYDIFFWLAILGEEVGELSKETLEMWDGAGSFDAVEKEAIQVATLALKIAWMVKKHREGLLSGSETEKIGGDLDAEEFRESQTEQIEEKEVEKG